MTRPRSYWPIALAGLLAVSAAVNLVVVAVATRDPSFAVERDYYRKALAWDETMAQEQRNADLGWRVDATLVPVGHPGRAARLDVRVADADAHPIDGARVTVEALHNARANDVFGPSLTAQDTGRYTGSLPNARRGLWELRIRVERGTAVFTTVLTRELVPQP
ncbi:MAG: FixH family protein [Candidatus Rokubacteria bacterium]|nr:FixH family protein [Candidatus Rokubacteria bacterium]